MFIVTLCYAMPRWCLWTSPLKRGPRVLLGKSVWWARLRRIACRLADRPGKAWVQTFFMLTPWCSYFGILVIRLLQLNHSKICLCWDHTSVVNQINSADAWLPRLQWIFIDFNQLWNCHSLETDGEANVRGVRLNANKHKWSCSQTCTSNAQH